MEKKKYKTTKEECKERLGGVCTRCGKLVEPIETEDNSGDPTFWGGCNNCNVLCWGVKKEIYEIAKKMVEEMNYEPYSHLDSPYGESDKYKDYWTKTQISGAVTTVRNVLACEAQLKEKTND